MEKTNDAPAPDPKALDKMHSLFEEYMESLRREGADEITIKNNTITIGRFINDYSTHYPQKWYADRIIGRLEKACNEILIHGQQYLRKNPLIDL